MSEKERSALIARLMAAASVLGLSLGMATATADAEQLKGEHKPGTTTTQIKGESQQGKFTTSDHKLTTNDHKLDTNQHKGETGFLKHSTETGFLKHNTGTSNQGKHNVPSSELNPQPEPPMQQSTGTPQNH